MVVHISKRTEGVARRSHPGSHGRSGASRTTDTSRVMGSIAGGADGEPTARAPHTRRIGGR